jgi:hypothetical protein
MWLGNFLTSVATRFLPAEGWMWFFATMVLAGVVAFAWRNRQRITGGDLGVQSWQLLLVGIGGTWIFLSLTLGAAAWAIYTGGSLIGPTTSEAEAGPLRWFYNLEMEGGPPTGRPVFALTFFGTNSSQKEVVLKTASLVSAKNGRKLDLEVLARDSTGQNVLVSLDQINLIPPGAPVRLVAKFGDPDPSASGKVLGLEAKAFLETWSQFFLNIEDDTRAYRLTFNEGSLMPFFPGMVGPHITKK